MLAMRSISLLTAFAVLTPLAGLDGVKLHWQFKAGDVLRYRMTMETTTELSIMPDKEMTSSMAMVMRENVTEVAADGTASIALTYEALRVDLDMGTAMSFDSTLKGDEAKANDPMLAKALAPILETKILMKMNSSGLVTEFSGAKELIAKVMEGVGPDGNGMAVQRMFSEDSIRKMAEVNVFPDKALNVGDTWKRSFEQAAPPIGSMSFAIDNKLEAQEQHGGSACAKISLATTVSFSSDDTAEHPMDVDLKGSEGTGTMWFDIEHGHMLEYLQSMDMKMAIGPKSEDGSAGETQFEVTTSLSSEMVWISKDALAFEPAAAKAAGGKK